MNDISIEDTSAGTTVTLMPTEGQLAPYLSILSEIDAAVQVIEYVAVTGDMSKLVQDAAGGVKHHLEEALFEIQLMYRAWQSAEFAREHPAMVFANDEEYVAAAEAWEAKNGSNS
jgi:hypothetical protein